MLACGRVPVQVHAMFSVASASASAAVCMLPASQTLLLPAPAVQPATLPCCRHPPNPCPQVVWSWVDEAGARMQRVITRRLRTTHNPAATAEALVPGVAAVVWAKSVLAQALERGAAFDRKEAEILRRSLGECGAGVRGPPTMVTCRCYLGALHLFC